MSINLTIPNSNTPQLKPRITVIGVGGAGGNAVNNMIDKQLEGVEFVVANTDAQALSLSKTDSLVQLGANVTEGLGAGSKPEVGRAAAEESLSEIEEQIRDSHMVFIAAGMFLNNYTIRQSEIKNSYITIQNSIFSFIFSKSRPGSPLSFSW